MVVSVIIPCYNVEDDIEDCVESVLSQTYQQLEIILVENNSSDTTSIKLKTIQQSYPDLIHVLEEKKQGAPAARNKGLSIAKGEWVQFLDADDILLPDKIATQVSLVHSNKHGGFVVGNYLYQLNESKRLRFNFQKNNPWIAFMKCQLGITSSCLWKKSSVLTVGGWNELMPSSQEYELIFDLLKKDIKIIYDDQYLTLVRRRENSISNQNKQGEVWKVLIEQRLRVRQHLAEYHQDLFTEIEVIINATLVEHLSKMGLYDLEEAQRLFRSAFKNKPQIEKPTAGKFYTIAYNTLGFKYGTLLYKYYLNLLRVLKRYDY